MCLVSVVVTLAVLCDSCAKHLVAVKSHSATRGQLSESGDTNSTQWRKVRAGQKARGGGAPQNLGRVSYHWYCMIPTPPVAVTVKGIVAELSHFSWKAGKGALTIGSSKI